MSARGEIIRATVAGRKAGRDGERVTACPYPATSLLRTAWIKAFTEARPVPADVDDDQAVE
ncbi:MULTISPECIES: Rmf/CrpP fold protein [unclassified Streptomyces]|uniref:Rmf/CrpP fold protein n=1 Tax=unclassified Streptomyces TaxID=2593676 RepID=UPI00344ED27C